MFAKSDVNGKNENRGPCSRKESRTLPHTELLGERASPRITWSKRATTFSDRGLEMTRFGSMD